MLGNGEFLSNRARFVRAMLTLGTVLITIVSYYFAIVIFYKDSYPTLFAIMNREFFVTCIFISLFWAFLDTWFKLNEVYRSRSFGHLIMYTILEGIVGVILLTATIVILGLTNYGRDVLLTFAGLSTTICFIAKVIFYKALRHYRKNGLNNKSVVFICDKKGAPLLNAIYTRVEWGYKIKAIIGDNHVMELYNGKVPVYPIDNTNIEGILTHDIDELIYARNYDSSKDILQLVDLCNELGVTFRLYSSFFNRLSTQTQLRYFDTNAVLTISNTPNNYGALLLKRIFDIVFSGTVLLCGMPFFLIIMLLIKLDSKGPVFFKQKRSGFKGKIFEVYKFRTMVVNAEALKEKLMSQNEMTGPVFKMTNDPRITRVGKFLRKSSIDEFPQFLNVFFGDMSIVGPRPPLPSEVEQYERWQYRRLAMKPGITCIWQIAPSRNSITFEDWMRMDMEYIDNWSLSLDIVVILKTIRTVFRADGK